MINFRSFVRTLWVFVTCLLLITCSQVAKAQTVGEYYWNMKTGGSFFTASPEETCKKYHASLSYPYDHIEMSGASVAYCYAKRPEFNSGAPSRWGEANRGQCPSARPYFDSINFSCVATKPNPPIEPPPCPAQNATEKVTYVVSNDGKTIIYNPNRENTTAVNQFECKLEILGTERCYTLPKSANPNQTMCTFTARQSGGKGQGGDPPPVPTVDADSERTDVPPDTGKSDGSCPKGTVNAGLSASGIPMCIGQGTDPKNAPPAPPKIEVEKNETLPDGSTKNTKTVTTTNTDLSKTTVTTVTITKPSGEKETVQDKKTTDSPSGKPGKETQPDEKKGDLCKENPNLAVCKNSTVTGKCGEISCMGDAIQCATLRAAAAMQCQQDKDIEALIKSPSTTLGNSILSGKDPMQGEIDLAMKSEEIDLSKEKLDNAGFLGGGSCLRPITVNLPGGNTYTQSFDLLCEEIQPLRYVIMFMAYVSAYMIVVRTVLGS